MKSNYSVSLAVCFLTSLAFLVVNQGQNPHWRGTIEEEDGILNISNPTLSLGNSAGRVIRLEEVMRIKDDGKQIVFRAPYGLKVGVDGSIYCYDSWQLYKFDAQGKFIFKIVKQGQGPGEAMRRTNFLLTNEEIIIQANNPPKVMRFDLNGTYKGENKTELTNTLELIGTFNGRVYGFLQELLHDELGKEGYVDFPANLYELNMEFTSLVKIATFPIRHYVVKGAWWARARLDYALKDSQNLFVSHTPEYQIVKYNIEKRQVEKTFTRKYARVKYPPPQKEESEPDTLAPPSLDFYYDIAKLLIFKDKLWVITSTRDKQNRRLADVYNIEGKYEDNFYLDFPDGVNPRNYAYGTIVSLGEYIYTIDEHEDGYFSIAKYQKSGAN